MKRAFRRYISLLMVALYVVFYVSANFFYHSHTVADSRLVHSHPFGDKGHSHSAAQLQLIDVVESASYQESEPLELADFVLSFESSVDSVCEESSAQLYSVLCHLLRAPPFSSVMFL